MLEWTNLNANLYWHALEAARKIKMRDYFIVGHYVYERYGYSNPYELVKENDISKIQVSRALSKLVLSGAVVHKGRKYIMTSGQRLAFDHFISSLLMTYRNSMLLHG